MKPILYLLITKETKNLIVQYYTEICAATYSKTPTDFVLLTFSYMRTETRISET